MKSLLLNLLFRQTKAILVKYHPSIIAVTGSVGKTTTKAAIATVLADRFRVRASKGNFNTELGVALTVLGADEEPGRSPTAWLALLLKAYRLLASHDEAYPNLLVLEFGADAPGDMGKLCDLAAPDVAVFTAFSPVHLANHPSAQSLADEEATAVMRVKPGGLAVLGADDPIVLAYRASVTAPLATFGLSDGADVRGENVALATRDDFSFEPGEEFARTSFTIVTRNSRADAVLPHLVGESPVRSALAATAVALHFGVSLGEIAARFKDLLPVPGRMHPIAGIKGCLLLDDSYNAAPASMHAALKALCAFRPAAGARRIAALGHMAELGPASEQEHRRLGFAVQEACVDLLVTVGEMSLDTRRAAIEAGLPEAQALHFDRPEEAGRALDKLVKKGDIVLVKGSQSARMEKVTKDLMAEPLLAETLLVRQYGKWLTS
ncbi:hypothetical protein EPO34_00320 [Patescibacteria group bacterium]|nr:MAG: hypothetical protein EPO34_00320 [Patescibacteria group bacterium]